MGKLIIDNDLLFGEVVEALREGKTATIPVKGGSMLPFIVGERDLVTLEKSDSYLPGDIVLFRWRGAYVLHRLLSVDRDGIAHIQGDAILEGTECPGTDEIFGRVITILKNGRREVKPSSQPWRAWRSLGRLRRLPLAIIRRFWNMIIQKNQ